RRLGRVRFRQIGDGDLAELSGLDAAVIDERGLAGHEMRRVDLVGRRDDAGASGERKDGRAGPAIQAHAIPPGVWSVYNGMSAEQTSPCIDAVTWTRTTVIVSDTQCWPAAFAKSFRRNVVCSPGRMKSRLCR